MVARPKGGRSDDWLTPPWLLHQIMDRFGPLYWDACPSKIANHWRSGGPVFSGILSDGLSNSWASSIWCNPPYSNIYPWVTRAAEQVGKGYCPLAILLLPVRSDTEWWQWIMGGGIVRGNAASVLFFRHRIRFINPTTLTQGASPTGGSCLAVFARGLTGPPICECVDWAPTENEHWVLQRIKE
jgi:phage N-6-adenine-methyltransferase